MKVNFESAVKILMEGRCEAIKPENDTCPIILCDDGSVSKVLTWKRGVGETSIPCTYVLCQWLVIGYQPKLETVEVKRWAIVDSAGKCLNSYPLEKYATDHVKDYSTPQDPLEVVELTGTCQRPVKEPVKRQYILENAALSPSGSGVSHAINITPFPEGAPLHKKGKLIFEYEED